MVFRHGYFQRHNSTPFLIIHSFKAFKFKENKYSGNEYHRGISFFHRGNSVSITRNIITLKGFVALIRVMVDEARTSG